jgi:hypothetical protein
VPVLASTTALLTAALGVATNRATDLLPNRWAWANVAWLWWILVVVLALGVALLTGLLNRSSMTRAVPGQPAVPRDRIRAVKRTPTALGRQWLQRRRRLTVVATYLMVTLMLTTTVAGLANGPFPKTETALPQHQVKEAICDRPELFCDSEILKPLVAQTGPVWPNGLRPEAVAWYRGPFRRYELDEGSGLQESAWTMQHYRDVAVVRLKILNTTDMGQTVAPSEFGLVVALNEPARLPHGVFQAYVPSFATPEMILVWIPPLPAATNRDSVPKLLPPLIIPARVDTRSYPVTALFDLSNVPDARIVGLAGGRLIRSSPNAPEKILLTSLRAAAEWPAEKTDGKAVFDDLTIEAPVKGGCYVDLTDAGFTYGKEYARVDCGRAHTVEVTAVLRLPPPVRYSDNDVNALVGQVCSSANTDGLDASLNAIPVRLVPDFDLRQRGEVVATCMVVSSHAARLWFGPKTAAAIEATS